MQNVSITVDGNTVNLEDGQTTATVSGLEPNKEYVATIKYSLDGTEYTTTLKCETKAYDPGIIITPSTYGFDITRSTYDPVLKTVGVTFTVDGSYTYNMGDVDAYKIEELFKDTTYTISYVCKVLDTVYNKEYTISVEEKEYKTLSYEAPYVDKFEENRKTEDSLRINDVKYKLEKDSGTYTFEEINFNKNTYEVKIVLEYEVDEIPYYVYSTTLVYEKAPCTHEYDNDCDEVCNLCEEERTITHSYVEATCQAPKTCSVCGKTEGEKLEHTPVIDEAKDATCKEEGLTEGSHCSVCNEVLVKQEKVEKKDHTPVKDEAVDATCKAEGLTEGSHCSVCNEVL